MGVQSTLETGYGCGGAPRRCNEVCNHLTVETNAPALMEASASLRSDREALHALEKSKAQLQEHLDNALARMEASKGSPSGTVKMNVDLQEVNAKMGAGRKVLRMLQDDEKIAVRHNFNQIKLDAMKDVKALGVAAKKAARDWKKDAGATEKAESKANMPEKIYEGDYEKSEISSEEQAIRAEEVRDRATH